jgi:branched-chain amino acid transport system substrate-binding protein
MKKIWIGLIAVVMVLCLGMLFSECTEKKETIKIGAILSLTGGNALQGNLGMNGILLAVDLINENGGIDGKKIELIIEDSQTTTKGTINALKKLQMNNIVALVSTGDIEFQAINVALTETDLPVMATTCSGMLDEGRNPLLFRYCFNEELQDSILMYYAVNTLNIKKIALSSPNNLYGKEINKYTKKHFMNFGGIFLSENDYNTNSTDQKLLSLKIIKESPEAICVRGFGSSFESILRAIKEQNYNGYILGDITLSLPTTINNTKGAVDNAFFVSVELNINSTNAFISNYVDKYRKKYKEEPCLWDALGFDSFNFIIEGIKLSKQKHLSIPEALYELDSVKLLLGNNKFNKNNDASFEMSIYKIENQQIIQCK